MFDKNDPILGSVQGVMQKTRENKRLEEALLEHYGVYSRKALPNELLAQYDADLKKVLEEGDDALQKLDKRMKAAAKNSEAAKKYHEKNKKAVSDEDQDVETSRGVSPTSSFLKMRKRLKKKGKDQLDEEKTEKQKKDQKTRLKKKIVDKMVKQSDSYRDYDSSKMSEKEDNDEYTRRLVKGQKRSASLSNRLSKIDEKWGKDTLRAIGHVTGLTKSQTNTISPGNDWDLDTRGARAADHFGGMAFNAIGTGMVGATLGGVTTGNPSTAAAMGALYGTIGGVGHGLVHVYKARKEIKNADHVIARRKAQGFYNEPLGKALKKFSEEFEKGTSLDIIEEHITEEYGQEMVQEIVRVFKESVLIEEMRENITEKLSRAYELGEEALDEAVLGLTKEEIDILGFSEAGNLEEAGNVNVRRGSPAKKEPVQPIRTRSPETSPTEAASRLTALKYGGRYQPDNKPRTSPVKSLGSTTTTAKPAPKNVSSTATAGRDKPQVRPMGTPGTTQSPGEMVRQSLGGQPMVSASRKPPGVARPTIKPVLAHKPVSTTAAQDIMNNLMRESFEQFVRRSFSKE